MSLSKKLTCKVTLRQVFYLSEAPSPPMIPTASPPNTLYTSVHSSWNHRSCTALKLKVGINLIHTGARIYRPSFHENKPKTLVFSNRSRAFWACFRENWVYCINSGKGRGGGEANQRGVRGAIVHTASRKYQHDWLCLQFVNTNKDDI